MRVIAMAYGCEPLDRSTAGEGHGVVYIVNSHLNRDEEHSECGVGFPKSCVFEFDATLYDSLRQVYDHGDTVALEALWSKATPVRAISDA